MEKGQEERVLSSRPGENQAFRDTFSKTETGGRQNRASELGDTTGARGTRDKRETRARKAILGGEIQG